MATPSSPDNIAGKNPYDWDQHKDLSTRIESISRVEYMLGRGLVDRDMAVNFVLKGPLGDDVSRISDIRQIDGRILAEYVPVRLRLMQPLIHAHLTMLRGRADILTRTVEAACTFFPEEKFRFSLFRMLKSVEAQVSNYKEGFLKIREIVDINQRNTLDDSAFLSSKNTLYMLRQSFRDTVGYDDIVPVSGRFNFMVPLYHTLAEMSLLHARAQVDLAEHCLAVVATDKVLTKLFNIQSSLQAKNFHAAAAFMLIAAAIDLEDSESAHDAIYVTNQANRPVFPVGPHLSKL